MNAMEILIQQLLRNLKFDPEQLKANFKRGLEDIQKTKEEFNARLTAMENSLKRIETALGIKSAEVIELQPQQKEISNG